MKNAKRILNSVLAAVIALTSIAIPASAASLGGSSDTVVFDQDFNTLKRSVYNDTLTKDMVYNSIANDGEDLFWWYRGSMIHEVDATHGGYDGTRALYMNARNGGRYYNDDNTISTSNVTQGAANTKMEIPFVTSEGASPVTTGYYIITCDYYPSVGKETFGLTGRTTFADGWPGDLDYLITNKGSGLTDLERAWYGIEITVDLDGKVAYYKATKKSDGTVVRDDHCPYTKGLGILEIQTDHQSVDNSEFSKAENSAIIDNIKIVKRSFGQASGADYLFAQDFTTSDSAVMDPSPLSAPPVVARHFGSQLWAGDYGHSDKDDQCLLISKDLAGSAAAQVSVGTVRTEGSYKLTYKLYPSNGSNILIIDSAQTGGARARTNATSPNCLWFSMPSSLASDRKWYDVEFIINLDTDDATITVRPEASDTVVHTDTKKYYAALGVFEFAQDIASSGSAYAARIDDIAFYNLYEDAPEFTESNIKCYANGELQEDLGNISKLTNEIVISFPQQIKGSTLLKSNIYLTDDAGNVVETSSAVVDGMECTLTLSDALVSGSVYTLHIENLENVSGYVMSDEFTQDFVVASATVVSALKNVTIGSDEVVSLDQLTAGSEITVNYSVSNATDLKQDTSIIVVYYDGANDIPVLVSCTVLPDEVAANTNADSLSKKCTVPSVAFDKVVVMLWDNVNDMKPLTNIIEFMD